MAGAAFVGHFVYDGDGAVHADGVFRIDDFKFAVAELFGRQVGFVFKGNQYVADVALDEGGGGRTAAVFENFDVGQHFFHIFARLRIIVAVGFQAVAVCAQEGVAAVAGYFGVGDDDFQVVLGQVVPVFNLFRVAFADEEDGGAGEGDGVVGEGFLPVGFDQAFFNQEFDVGALVHGNDVGFQAVGHGQCLFARTAVRLLDGDVRAVVLFFVFCGKQRVEVFVEVAGDIVGDVEQFDAAGFVPAAGSGILRTVVGRAGGEGGGEEQGGG